MVRVLAVIAACVFAISPSMAQSDTAAQFGARENIESISLSPDGTSVAYVSPTKALGSALYTVKLDGGEPRLALAADGNPVRLGACNWVSNARLVCATYNYQKVVGEIYVSSRLIAVDADGGNIKLVSRREGQNALGIALSGGGVIDWLPDEDGAVLMTRIYVPEARIGSLVEKRDTGLGVDRVDTLTLKASIVERARANGTEYISDGRGNVRIMGTQALKGATGYSSGKVNYYYRRGDDREWRELSNYDVLASTGFNPFAVDSEQNVVYGFEKLDGRQALYRVALDGSMLKELVFAHDRVDVDGLVRLGRRQKVVGVTFATDKRQAVYFDKQVGAMVESLGKALPDLPQLQVVDSSVDGNRMLVWGGGDRDPGQYYVFDRTAKSLNKILLARPQLDGVKLAAVKPVEFKAADGTLVPGYLTLPDGSAGKKLPAIVMPHGGPEARDEWGFDWLAQYYASRGYAVLQPNFRGSTGYGDAWFQNNGFKSWRIAVGDVADAGRWLVSEGIADPAKLAIIGWSYGGYAALQSNVLDPDLFKAVVAIAPVTDFQMTIDGSRGFTDYLIARERIGGGAHVREGSPAQHAAKFKAPVMLFHGDMDRNVGIAQSRLMADRLKGAGRKAELVIYPGLAHNIDDATARADMLRRSDAFLKAAMGL